MPKHPRSEQNTQDLAHKRVTMKEKPSGKNALAMNASKIDLKPVYDLRVDADNNSLRYHIPAYQRGYRWTITQVSQLLDDIREFTKRESPQPEDFYCLQPLVLRERVDGSYEVIDGQQRLTTLLLILRHFNERLASKFQQTLYCIEYATRPELDEFLENPSAEQAASNIDFYHINQAVETISAWFKQRESEVEVIKDAFLNKVKIIWFQLSPEDNAVAAFTRLNVGKIPLTNSELIRALFLKRGKEKVTGALQLRIAHEWDTIEKTLQDESFWGFLSNDRSKRDGRIGFVFEHVAREGGMKPGVDEYATFNFFSQKLGRPDALPETEWLAVKRTFMLLEEWFQDRRLYHMVGYLVWAGEDVNVIRAIAAGATKHDFKQKLRGRIFEKTFKSACPEPLTKDWLADYLDGIGYGSGAQRVRAVLLLFNIASLLLNARSNMRFQFDSFKDENWDIEHVRSCASERPASRVGQVEWANRCLSYLKQADQEVELQTQIEEFIKLPPKDITDVTFDPVYLAVLKHFQETDEDEADNGLFNLALLDSETNRSYKNAVFAVKRERVLALDRNGVFVPLCTRNVFLKCYNPHVDHVMFWNEQDQQGYRLQMIDVLHDFFTGGWIHG